MSINWTRIGVVALVIASHASGGFAGYKGGQFLHERETRKTAIAYGCAHYNETTGDYEWQKITPATSVVMDDNAVKDTTQPPSILQSPPMPKPQPPKSGKKVGRS